MRIVPDHETPLNLYAAEISRDPLKGRPSAGKMAGGVMGGTDAVQCDLIFIHF